MKLATLLSLAISVVGQAAKGPSTVEELFQTEENLAIATSPDRVEACILYVKDPWFSKDLSKRKYKEGKSKPVPQASAELLSAKLADSTTYGWNYAKGCMPVWNARVKFFRGAHHVSADFCFGCGIVMFSRNGQPFSGEDFDEASPAIFEVVRSLFPEDRVILEILASKRSKRARDTEMQRLIESGKEQTNQSPQPTTDDQRD